MPAAAVQNFPEIFRGDYGANNAKARRWWADRNTYNDGNIRLSMSNTEDKRKVSLLVDSRLCDLRPPRVEEEEGENLGWIGFTHCSVMSLICIEQWV